MRDKRALIVGGIAIFLGLAYWLWTDASKPLPGESFSDLGREHITDIAEFKYNSNPPTSGSHFPVWAKKGVYDRAISDGYLIHSLEHGYIVISYNCDYQNKKVSNESKVPRVSRVLAHEEDLTESTKSGEATDSGTPLVHMVVPAGGASWYTPENPPAPEVSLLDSFRTVSCKNLVDQLYTLTKAADRVIVVPRPSLDSNVALSSWTRLMKFNLSGDTLSQDQFKQAEEFIKAFHNKGPEKTME